MLPDLFQPPPTPTCSPSNLILHSSSSSRPPYLLPLHVNPPPPPLRSQYTFSLPSFQPPPPLKLSPPFLLSIFLHPICLIPFIFSCSFLFKLIFTTSIWTTGVTHTHTHRLFSLQQHCTVFFILCSHILDALMVEFSCV